MALWGNKDSKTASGTISIADTGVVTGSSTAFTTQAKVGNTIKAGGVEYQIVDITSDTAAKVIMGTNNGNGTVTTVSSSSYTLSEKPAYVAHESTDSGIGASGNSSKVFGVDVEEVYQGSNDVVEVAVVNAGTGYKEVPNVTFASGTQTATAAISGGSVSVITITGAGAYSAIPDVYVDVPRRTIPTSGVSTSTEVITYTGHGLATGDRIRYSNGGSTTLTGLTSGTTYYAIVTGDNTFKVATTAENATAGTAVNLTGTGNNAQYFDLLDETTATVQAALGSGAGGTQVTHTGWVRRTVGTGGRAGRVFYETLVAGGSINGDAADDIQFADN
jgi:hypothetical protein